MNCITSQKMTLVQTAANARQVLMANKRDRMDRLADLVSEGNTIRAAAASMGISESAALGLWSQIKRSLGWQAQ